MPCVYGIETRCLYCFSDGLHVCLACHSVMCARQMKSNISLNSVFRCLGSEKWRRGGSGVGGLPWKPGDAGGGGGQKTKQKKKKNGIAGSVRFRGRWALGPWSIPMFSQ